MTGEPLEPDAATRNAERPKGEKRQLASRMLGKLARPVLRRAEGKGPRERHLVSRLSYLVYLFYNMPLHVDEQHRVLGVGSMAELILHEPLRDESHASESELPAEQTMEAGAIVREAMLARADTSRSQRMVHQADGSCAWEAAQRGVVRGSAPFPMLSGGEAYDLRPPLSAHPSRLTPVRGPGASCVCPTLLWYTAGVPLELGSHDGRAADAACHTGHVADPCSHVPPSDDAQHAALAGLPHTTRASPRAM